MRKKAFCAFNDNDQVTQISQNNYGSGLDKKVDRIMEFVLETGNFGHNRERTHGKIQSAWSKTKDFVRHARIFLWIV